MRHEERIQALKELLPPKRLHHCKCVAEAARALALQYGADSEKAYEAGWLHDCAKYFSREETADWCRRYNKPLSEAELGLHHPVCHAFAGEAFLALEWGITDEEVLSAVRWHTTGHAGMTLLEEIIFVADLVSADREYPDVEQTRALAKEDLHAASKYVLDYVFAKLKQKGKPVHPDSLAWYEELLEKLEDKIKNRK